jgi:hypothetical protein
MTCRTRHCQRVLLIGGAGPGGVHGSTRRGFEETNPLLSKASPGACRPMFYNVFNLQWSLCSQLCIYIIGVAFDL